MSDRKDEPHSGLTSLEAGRGGGSKGPTKGQLATLAACARTKAGQPKLAVRRRRLVRPIQCNPETTGSMAWKAKLAAAHSARGDCGVLRKGSVSM